MCSQNVPKIFHAPRRTIAKALSLFLGLFAASSLSGCFLMLPFIESDYKPKTAEDRLQGGPPPRVASRRTAADPLAHPLRDLGSPNAAVRTRAVTAIGDLGPRGLPALPQLTSALGDSSKNVRRATVKALEKVDPPGLEALLEPKLRDPDPYVRESTRNILKRRTRKVR